MQRRKIRYDEKNTFQHELLLNFHRILFIFQFCEEDIEVSVKHMFAWRVSAISTYIHK